MAGVTGEMGFVKMLLLWEDLPEIEEIMEDASDSSDEEKCGVEISPLTQEVE